MKVLGTAFAYNRSVQELVMQQAEAAAGKDVQIRKLFMDYVFPDSKGGLANWKGGLHDSKEWNITSWYWNQGGRRVI